MIDNMGMYQGYTVEGSAKLKFEPEEKMEHASCSPCHPVMECPEERCVHREIYHDVTHVKPIHTRIINHHIYRHSYRPSYTCSEENEVCNVVDNCKFM